MESKTLMEQTYVPLVQAAREQLQTHPTVAALLSPDIDALVLERFLIQYSALGVQITEPVDGWISRAGGRTVDIGMKEIGEHLTKHAKHEAGHHLMLLDDTKHMVESWNGRGNNPKLDLTALLTQSCTQAMNAYIKLHEDVIASEQPFGQVAIELEIEGISVAFLPGFIENCKRVLGDDVLAGMSFLTEHAALDVGHTAFNERLMNRLLEQRPEAAARLAQIGSDALGIYIAFFGECLATAQAEVKRSRSAGSQLSA